jgi:hypothetical protein
MIDMSGKYIHLEAFLRIRTNELELKARQVEPFSFNPNEAVAFVATMLWRFIGQGIARK